MPDLTQMIVRLVIAMILGAILGIERELVGKEAGVRTGMLVAAGSALFTMTALLLPMLIPSTAHGSAMSIIANIVVGIGFLGGGIIIKSGEHVRGLTTAAVVWTTAAIGILVGLGFSEFATVATVLMSGLLYFLRTTKIERIKD
jgi:putative Mg2+ transporter-C (MgtC) family protein